MKFKVTEKEISLRKCYTELTDDDAAIPRERQPIIKAHLDKLPADIIVLTCYAKTNVFLPETVSP